MAKQVNGNGKVVSFELEKETKNTFKYGEVPERGKPTVIGTLYVQKWALPDAPTTVSIVLGPEFPEED